MDLFESGPGSPQIHDFQGGIPPNGLFWTVALPPGAFSMNRKGRRGRLEVKGICQIDSFVFAGANSTPAELDLSVEWEATGPPEERGSGSSVPPTDPAAFLGTFRTARAKGTFAGIELGYAFKTQGLATSDLG
ncbi:MAG: hypothetical protein ACREON_18490, partial [Gemmatimonadaceae bacterium]